MIIEGIQGVGGIKIPTTEFMQELRKACSATGTILILDEATSALDNATEAAIQHSLDELCRGRTTIVVAHRLSTVKNADEIIVVTQDGIKESGTHSELLAAGGMYAELYNSQFALA